VTTALQDYRRRIARRARRCNVVLAPVLADHLAAYLELLAVWNKRINLTALDDADAAVDRLVLEPLLAAKYLSAGAAVIDIGSGGGSPAIPLKIVVPGITLTMVESKTRKAAFLRDAVRHLGLEGVSVESKRYEELLGAPHMHESMDVVTVRAVRVETSVLLSLQAFLRVGGQVLLFRGPGKAGVEHYPPPLEFEAEQPLVESLRSRLVILRRQEIGSDVRPTTFHVER
jgi:16S rRNA (guanine527-N7)-methyltransferase